MVVSVTRLCDPGHYQLKEAIHLARSSAQAVPGFEIELVRYLQSRSLSGHVPIARVFRGLEILGGMLGSGVTDENRLVSLFRPFLRSSDPQIASKCVLVMARRSANISWVSKIMAEIDERIRANVVEALWGRREPEVEQLLRNALDDPHPRVTANAAYGLFLLGDPGWLTGLERLLSNENPAFRVSGIFLLRSSGAPEARERIKSFIRDPDSRVRRAAFNALIHLRAGAGEACDIRTHPPARPSPD